MKTLEELIKDLPPYLKDEVRDFAQWLLESKVSRKQKRLRLTWAGGSREYRDRCASVEL